MDWTIGVDNSDTDSFTVVAGSNSIPITVDTSGVLNVNLSSGSAPAFSFSNASDTGFYRTSSDTIAFSTGFVIGGKTISHDLVRDYLENAYIAGKMTKAELIGHLTNFYQGNGLDMAETMEEIEIANEKFIKQILETK